MQRSNASGSRSANIRPNVLCEAMQWGSVKNDASHDRMALPKSSTSAQPSAPHTTATICRITYPKTMRLPCSPDLNLIEQAISKIKQAIRHTAARTAKALTRAAVAAMRTVTPSDIRGYLIAAGYLAHVVSNGQVRRSEHMHL